jgi:hypothetical protein
VPAQPQAAPQQVNPASPESTVGPTTVPGASLAAKLAWLQTNAQNNTNYTIEVNADETINPTTLSYSGRTNIGITLIGIGGVRTISLSSQGSLFTVGTGVTLTLGNNITLQGLSDNNASLVQIYRSGTLVMDEGSKITGNITTVGVVGGGGVNVNGGTFTMNGGEISGNTIAPSDGNGGGGVRVYNATFTMNGGEISGNTATAGGGVMINSATFIMNDGKISGNITRNSNFGGGGGVNVNYNATFIMNGGEISGNTAVWGGGVIVYLDSTFRITNGTIYGSNEPNTNLRNTDFFDDYYEGAALNVSTNATAQRGTFSGETWVSSGNLSTTNNTIRVVNGNIQ